MGYLYGLTHSARSQALLVGPVATEEGQAALVRYIRPLLQLAGIDAIALGFAEKAVGPEGNCLVLDAETLLMRAHEGAAQYYPGNDEALKAVTHDFAEAGLIGDTPA